MVNCRVGFSGPGPRQTKGFILEVSAEHLLRAGEKPGSHPFLQDEAPSHRFQSRGTECAVTPARPHDFCSPPRATLAAGMFPTHVGVFLPRGLGSACLFSGFPPGFPPLGASVSSVSPLSWASPDGRARHLLSHAASTCPLVSSSPSRVQALRGREHPMRCLALSRPSAGPQRAGFRALLVYSQMCASAQQSLVDFHHPSGKTSAT